MSADILGLLTRCYIQVALMDSQFDKEGKYGSGFNIIVTVD